MRSFHFDVGDGHELLVRVRGEIDSDQPVILFVHGGPGAGVLEKDLALFDDCRQPVVWVDQRGAGGSRFTDRMQANTTDHLIADFEQLRKHLHIKCWILVGGSWGSTLSLAYAIAHRPQIQGMILHGIFLLNEAEMAWFYRGGAAHLYPDEYARYLDHLPSAQRHDPLAGYHQLLQSADESARIAAARAWSRWEAVNSFLEISDEQIAAFDDPKLAVPMATLETTYFMNHGYFPEDDFLVNHCPAIADLPTTIVHGRYDTICPLSSAWRLHQALPCSSLTICPKAAHDASEPQIQQALREAIAALPE